MEKEKEEEKAEEEYYSCDNAVSGEAVKWYGYCLIASDADIAAMHNSLKGISLANLLRF